MPQMSGPPSGPLSRYVIRYSPLAKAMRGCTGQPAPNTSGVPSGLATTPSDETSEPYQSGGQGGQEDEPVRYSRDNKAAVLHAPKLRQPGAARVVVGSPEFSFREDLDRRRDELGKPRIIRFIRLAKFGIINELAVAGVGFTRRRPELFQPLIVPANDLLHLARIAGHLPAH